jgi:methylenetetrahydrofolate dehydrogenase (NADP+)/methenyltetrahydrofolate cyclohydrolase
MTAEILSGTAMRGAILEELRAEARDLRLKYGRAPGLATILIGDDPASVSYVANKVRTAAELGLHEARIERPADVSREELLELIAACNDDPAIDGILVQLPLPAHISARSVIHAIRPDKDVDGFHPVNLGRLMLGEPALPPCTPAAVREMLIRSATPVAGAEVVIVGRSNIVGRPLAVMLGQKGNGADATVTLAHSRSRALDEHCRRADILIAAAGTPGLIRADWIKSGATVIDVGVSRIGLNPATGKAVLRGDVDFERAVHVAGRITPVPGGVGPMTIAMLMKNTVRSARARMEGAVRRI